MYLTSKSFYYCWTSLTDWKNNEFFFNQKIWNIAVNIAFHIVYYYYYHNVWESTFFLLTPAENIFHIIILYFCVSPIYNQLIQVFHIDGNWRVRWNVINVLDRTSHHCPSNESTSHYLRYDIDIVDVIKFYVNVSRWPQCHYPVSTYLGYYLYFPFGHDINFYTEMIIIWRSAENSVGTQRNYNKNRI